MVDDLRTLTERQRQNGRSYAGFNPAREEETRLFAAVLAGDHIAQGFRNKDIRLALHADDPEERGFTPIRPVRAEGPSRERVRVLDRELDRTPVRLHPRWIGEGIGQAGGLRRSRFIPGGRRQQVVEGGRLGGGSEDPQLVTCSAGPRQERASRWDEVARRSLRQRTR